MTKGRGRVLTAFVVVVTAAGAGAGWWFHTTSQTEIPLSTFVGVGAAIGLIATLIAIGFAKLAEPK